MSDFLAYRIPNSEPVRMVGDFNLINKNNEPANGFVFSNFNQNKQYIFEQKSSGFENLFELHFSQEEPKVISKEQYLNCAKRISRFLKNESLDKFVFSRIKKVTFDSAKTLDLFEKLCIAYPNAFVYLISSKTEGTWIGATPETLLQSFKDSGFTMALAGTKEKTKKEPWSQKEYIEQQWVSDYILETLRLYGIKNIEFNGPYESEAGNLLHLRTDFSFDSQDLKTLDLARRLHPTPAVSGLPKTESIALINQIENHELGYSRDFYAGFLGLIGPDISQLYVNLRCCQIYPEDAFLYIGGGYTKDSIAENEWEETEFKSETLLRVFEKM